MGGNTEHYTTQGEVCKNSILSHTKCRSENDLLMVLCFLELTIHMHPGTGQHVIFTLLYNWIGFCHGQILIETATHSLHSLLKRWVENTSLDAIMNVPEPARNYHAITIEHWTFKFS